MSKTALQNLLLTSATLGAAFVAACGGPADVPVGDGRSLTGTAPAGTDRVLVIDADGLAFDAVPGAGGLFDVKINSGRPVSIFVVGADGTRVLRVAASPGATPSLTSLPPWTGAVSTAQLSTCDCNEDGIDEEVEAEDNPLDQIDSDEDGEANAADDDDDNDGVADDEDADDDGAGTDEDDDLDSDDDGRPDLCDDDDDDDGISDDEDADEAGDTDDDGVADDDDGDDDNDGDHDDDDSDDDNDGTDDDGTDDSDDGVDDV